MESLPVVVLTGYLGAGKTTLLNHLLQRPGSRIGVIENDFGAVNVDSGLIAGQVDEPATISGGCLCCLPDAGGLDDALSKLADPKRDLEAIVIEASGVADPLALVRILGMSRVPGIRIGGLVDVVDSVEYFRTVDTGVVPPARFAAATLVVLNKVDALESAERDATLARIEARVRERNPRVLTVAAIDAAIDPALVFDPAPRRTPADELPIAELLRQDYHPHHEHADSVTATATEPVDPAALATFLADPPEAIYRVKGRVAVREGAGVRRYVLHIVGGAVHLAPDGRDDAASELVAIGLHLDEDAVRGHLRRALAAAPECTSPRDAERLRRYRRLSR